MTRSTVKSLAKEIASQILKEKEGDLNTHTVRDAFEYYFKTKDVSKSTMDGKKNLYGHIKNKGYLDTPIKDMTGAMIREFIDKLTLNPASLHSLYSRLMSILGHYIKEHNLKVDLPVGLIKNVKPQEREECEYLTWDQLQVLLAMELEAKRDQYYLDLFCLMCLTGMSIGDTLKFTPKVSLNGNWITYNREKTGATCMLPLLPQARTIISRNDWPAKISKRSVQAKCETLISALVGRRIRTHGGRKTFGAIALELNFSIEAVSKMMGHSSPLLTSKIYAKVSQAKIEREMNDLPMAVKQMMGL